MHVLRLLCNIGDDIGDDDPEKETRRADIYVRANLNCASPRTLRTTLLAMKYTAPTVVLRRIWLKNQGNTLNVTFALQCQY
jgi:hypothetical protein